MEQKDKKRFLSPSGAGIVAVCFFLPWVKFSCSGTTSYASGAKLGGGFWLVFAAAVIIIGAFFYFKSINQIQKSKPIILLSSIIGLCVIIYKYISFASGTDTGFGRITPDEVGLEIQFGGVLTLIGLIISLIGTSFLTPENRDTDIKKSKTGCMSILKFSKEDLEQINKTVQQAESKTSGEIATAFIKESYDYAIYELIFAVICGFLYFVVMMFFVYEVETFIKQMFWVYSNNYLLLFYGFSTFLVISIFYFIANISMIDRLIVFKKVMKQKVKERAVRHFMESGVNNTRDRTGILIFISFLERRIELIADKGINEKIPQEKWNSIVENIIQGIKSGKVIEKLKESILECGKILEKHFPIKPDDTNELSDDVTILEK